MSNDDSHWLPILVRGDVTEWERTFCASLIDQTRKGRRLSTKQAAILSRIKAAFFSRTAQHDDAPLIEGRDANE
jgi:hypothetical protein